MQRPGVLRRRVTAILTAVAAAATLAVAPLGARAAGVPDQPVTLDAPGLRPRLVTSAAELPALQARIAAGGTPAAAAASITTAADDLVGDGRIDPARLDDGKAASPLLTLSIAWWLTGDQRYLDELDVLWPAVRDAPFHGMPWVYDLLEWYNRRGNALVDMAMAYDLAADALSPDARAAAFEVLRAEGQVHLDASGWAWWNAFRSGSNFTGNNGAAIGVVALALRDEMPAATVEAWVAVALRFVDIYLDNGFADGASFEGPLYGNYGLRNPTILGAALLRATDGRVDLLADPRLDRFVEWTASYALPGGGAINPLNDARYAPPGPRYLTWRSQRGPDTAMAAWTWQHLYGVRGDLGDAWATLLWLQPPPDGFTPDDAVARTSLFRGDGLVAARTGWDTDDLLTSFQGRQSMWGVNGVHYNQDVGHFTLYAGGARLAIDNGYSNALLVCGGFYGFGPKACPASQTSGHNAVTVNGRTQDPFTSGRFLRHVSTARPGDPGVLDLSSVDAASAWYFWWAPKRDVRRHLVVRGEVPYVIVADDVDGGAPFPLNLLPDWLTALFPTSHSYEWWLHTDKANTAGEPRAVPGGLDWDVAAPNGTRMAVHLAAPQPLAGSVETFEPDYAEVGPHPRLGVSTRGTSGLQSVAALVPLAPGAPEPVVTRNGATLELAWPDGTRDVATLGTDRVGGVAPFRFTRTLPEGTQQTAADGVVAAPGVVCDSPGAVISAGGTTVTDGGCRTP